MKKYNPGAIEKKWQKIWEKEGVYRHYGRPKKAYVLDMFPYPSGSALHVGHPKGYIATDVFARMRQLQGYGVLHPMGWDAFGLPAEQHAIKNKVHPEKSVKENIARFKKQLQSIGFTYDWEREITTTDPEYYKWTQWIFLQLFQKGLAYQSYEPINWCPSCQTGLANEDLENGRCERCGSTVEKKPMRQWVLRMTDYADRLLSDLDPPAGGENIRWPESIKEQQRNWIGRSEGAVVNFLVPRFFEILLASDNESKKRRVEKFFEISGLPIRVHTPKSLGLTGKDIREEGGLKENALEKALAYREATDLPILGTDAGFFIEGEDIDPTRPKRNALEGKDERGLPQKEVSENMTAYYRGIAKKHGGKVEAAWVDEWVLLLPDKSAEYSTSRREVILTDQIHGKADEYLPLRSLYISKTTNKPASMQNDEEEIREMRPMIQAINGLAAYTLPVFTTRLDTIFGATYVVVAPEHPLVNKQLTENSQRGIKNKEEVEKYLKEVQKKTELERTDLAKEKTGVKLEGLNAVNPFTKESVPIFVADYVLGSYGTGAIMAVPAHDERDFAFAKKYGLPIKTVIRPPGKQRVILIHGKGGPEEYLPWLKGELEAQGYAVEAPILPNPAEPNDEEQTNFIIENFVIDKNTILLGHSFGGVVALRLLERGHNVGRVILAATPYTGDFLDGKVRPTVKEALGKGFNFEKIKKQARSFVVLQDKGDQIVSERDGEQYAENLDSLLLSVQAEKSHFDGVQEPELLATITSSTSPQLFTEDGLIANSVPYDGMKSEEARGKMAEWLEENGLGKKKVNYKMRDWVFSRQRYWGEPIPIIHCEKCGVVPVPESDLPVKLPHVKSYEPTGTGESPLANIASWVNVKCPICGGPAKRETNTMPQWAGSSWYYLRFIDPKNEKALVDSAKEKKMMPVDVYVGGTEHATRHLLYARFWHKFLYDIGIVSSKEPFTRLVNQGLILASDGRKMSKRWGNVINPDEMVAEFGADAFRLYEMFMGPFGQSIAWNTDGVVGTRRFLEKVWKLQGRISNLESRIENKGLESLLHKTIKKVTKDIEEFKFNTAVSALMILVNALENEVRIPDSSFKILLLLISPFAPHISEELWNDKSINPEGKSIFLEKWPSYQEEFLKDSEVKIAVQINGKLRDIIDMPSGSDEEDVRAAVFNRPKIKDYISEKEIKKFIWVPDKIVNIVL